MLKRHGQADVTDANVLALREPLSAFVSAWVNSSDAADDIVQETITRVLECRSRLEPGTLRAYALAVARNLIISQRRAEDVSLRHRHRLVEPTTTHPPEDDVLKHEEWAALAAAFARLPERHQKLLFAHEVHDEGTGTLASVTDSSEGAIAAALARARARLRLEYVLTLRRVALPTPRCRSVLEAVTLGDRRRQKALDAGQHLLDCPVCADLSPVLETRQRPLWGLLAPAWLLHAAHRIRQGVKDHPVQTTVGTAFALGIVIVVLVVAIREPTPAPNQATAAATPTLAVPTPAATGTVFVGAVPILPLSPTNVLATFIGQEAMSNGAPVESVPADEGFWIGNGTNRLWVQLETPVESSAQIRAGQQVAFRGRVTANPPDFAQQIGVVPSEGAEQLATQGVHIRVSSGALTVR
jgi:RNA polymerase sigma factor (sigma-70 family)